MTAIERKPISADQLQILIYIWRHPPSHWRTPITLNVFVQRALCVSHALGWFGNDSKSFLFRESWLISNCWSDIYVYHPPQRRSCCREMTLHRGWDELLAAKRNSCSDNPAVCQHIQWVYTSPGALGPPQRCYLKCLMFCPLLFSDWLQMQDVVLAGIHKIS